MIHKKRKDSFRSLRSFLYYFGYLFYLNTVNIGSPACFIVEKEGI